MYKQNKTNIFKLKYQRNVSDRKLIYISHNDGQI